MATGGEVPGQNPDCAGSEDLDNLKCQLCLEDGLLHEAVGMCFDCNDYLCESCYNVHRRSRPTRNHQLIDKGQILQSQVRASTKDTCTEKCEDHEDEVIKYYCTHHGTLGCTACVTLGHKTCEDVIYIPHVAKDLASNAEYGKAEKRLKSALKTFKKVSDNAQHYSKGLEASYAEAVESIREFRRSVDEALGQLEAEMIEKVEAIKAEQMKELAALGEKHMATQVELQSALGKVEALQGAGQNCSVFTEMMRTKEKLATLDDEIIDAMRDASCQKKQIKFFPNQDTLEMMKHPHTFVNISASARKIVQAKHLKDLNVKVGTDSYTCRISGLVILNGVRLVLADFNNYNVKIMSVLTGQILTSLKLSSQPRDISAIGSNKVVVTMPDEKQVAIIAVEDSAMRIERTLAVNGQCLAINYRNGQLAVSYQTPHKIEVLSLQGSVLHTLSKDNLGHNIFNYPYYLTYGQDDATLYISNYSDNNVLCVKLDGTVYDTYKDWELMSPRQPIVANNGDVLVCAEDSNTVHQITEDCKKIRILLNKAGGLNKPCSICLCEEEGMMFIGMRSSNIVKVYKVEQETQ